MPYRKCTRFDKCSVNNCPLYPNYPNMYVHPDDVEQKCPMSKNYRYNIGKNYPDILKYQGLTPREFSSKAKWESKTEEEKNEIIIRLKSNSKFVAKMPPVLSEPRVMCNDSPE